MRFHRGGSTGSQEIPGGFERFQECKRSERCVRFLLRWRESQWFLKASMCSPWGGSSGCWWGSTEFQRFSVWWCSASLIMLSVDTEAADLYLMLFTTQTDLINWLFIIYYSSRWHDVIRSWCHQVIMMSSGLFPQWSTDTFSVHIKHEINSSLLNQVESVEEIHSVWLKSCFSWWNVCDAPRWPAGLRFWSLNKSVREVFSVSTWV